jgi:protein gp37
MGKTSIEWTDASWNPIVGCTEISPGCANCYAARLASTRLRNTPQYKGLAAKLKSEIQFPAVHAHGIPEGTIQPRWTGEVRLLLERLQEPLRWRKPRRIFVCDMGDLFHESVDAEAIGLVVQTIAKCPQHTFQILTKRAARMKEIFSGYTEYTTFFRGKPLPNVWLGVSVENQHFADERIPLLLETPAAVRWISAEPLLGGVKLPDAQSREIHRWPQLDWVVCGGESGANARPMHPDWARSLRDQCKAAGVPFFFKQWGEWLHVNQMEHVFSKSELDSMSMHTRCREAGNGDLYFKVGKKRAGRQLDGSDWNQFPQVAP